VREVERWSSQGAKVAGDGRSGGWRASEVAWVDVDRDQEVTRRIDKVERRFFRASLGASACFRAASSPPDA